MSTAPQIALLPDGRRLHLHHGPIDLVIEVIGAPREAAYSRAIHRFESILSGLVAELPALRRPLDGNTFDDPVARRMSRAVARFSETFVTPMAAVAGAVADEVLAALVAGETIPKAYVNNGGDIAIHLMPGQSATSLGPTGNITIPVESPSRGLATSGRGGRSHSLGIADAVTVAAENAATADVAATLIANAVDLPGHPAITRVPASHLNPESDLREYLVTTGVGQLCKAETAEALRSGQIAARRYVEKRLIHQAALNLNRTTVFANSIKESTLTYA